MNPIKAKYKNNWKAKTLESLEKDYWGEPTHASYLVKTCHELRKKPLEEFEVEDLRIMIGQNIGLKFLIPMAVEILKINAFAEGDFYPGDLLKSVVSINKSFWKKETIILEDLEEIIRRNQMSLREILPDILDKYEELQKG